MPDIFGSIKEITLLGYLIRTLIVGLVGFLVGRILPRRAFSQLTTYDFALVWILGALTVSPLLDGRVSFTYMTVPLLTLFFWHITFSLISLKNRRFSFFFNGKPAILIENGKVIIKNLKKQFLNVELLLSELRAYDVFDISEVKYAVLEPNGHLSVMKYDPHSQVTPSDLNLSAKATEIPLIVINEGKIVKENLQEAGVDATWLVTQLSAQNVTDIKDVFLSTIDRSKKLFVLRTDKKEPQE